MNEFSSSPASLLFLQAAKYTALLARQTFNHCLHAASFATVGDGLLTCSHGHNSHTHMFIAHASCGQHKDRYKERKSVL